MMFEFLLGFAAGMLFFMYVVLPRGLRSFIKDHNDHLFVEKIEDVNYYVQISTKMEPSKLRERKNE